MFVALFVQLPTGLAIIGWPEATVKAAATALFAFAWAFSTFYLLALAHTAAAAARTRIAAAGGSAQYRGMYCQTSGISSAATSTSDHSGDLREARGDVIRTQLVARDHNSMSTAGRRHIALPGPRKARTTSLQKYTKSRNPNPQPRTRLQHAAV